MYEHHYYPHYEQPNGYNQFHTDPYQWFPYVPSLLGPPPLNTQAPFYPTTSPLHSLLMTVPPPQMPTSAPLPLEHYYTSELQEDVGDGDVTGERLDEERGQQCGHRSALDADSDGSEVDYNLMTNNLYYRVLSTANLKDKPKNWCSSVMFNGRIGEIDLPQGIRRPQQADGSLTDEVRLIVERSLAPAELAKVRIAYGTRASSPAPRLAPPLPSSSASASATASRGYVLPNGTTWVRRKPDDAGKTKPSQPSETPPRYPSAYNWSATSSPAQRKRKFANNSLVIANGRRIYTGTSNECIAYAHNGECTSGILCVYDHEGSDEHRKVKLCRRNGARCALGSHALAGHQRPVCQYYLNVECADEACAYLHVKHTAGVDACSVFQRGACLRGSSVSWRSGAHGARASRARLQCDNPHRYVSTIFAQRAASAAAAAASSAATATPAYGFVALQQHATCECVAADKARAPTNCALALNSSRAHASHASTAAAAAERDIDAAAASTPPPPLPVSAADTPPLATWFF